MYTGDAHRCTKHLLTTREHRQSSCGVNMGSVFQAPVNTAHVIKACFNPRVALGGKKRPPLKFMNHKKVPVGIWHRLFVISLEYGVGTK